MSFPFSSFSLFFLSITHSVILIERIFNLINACYHFADIIWFYSCSMNFRIIFTVLAVYLCVFVFFMTYSISSSAFWIPFSLFLFEPPPFSTLADVFLRSLTFPLFFRTYQLIISTKNLRVLLLESGFSILSLFFMLYIRY